MSMMAVLARRPMFRACYGRKHKHLGGCLMMRCGRAQVILGGIVSGGRLIVSFSGAARTAPSNRAPIPRRTGPRPGGHPSH